MTIYNLPEDVLDLIKGLADRVDKLERLTRSPSTSIDNGALVIKKGSSLIAVLGDVSRGGYTNLKKPDGTPQMGTILLREGGNPAFAVWDDDPLNGGYKQWWALTDNLGRIIMSEDVLAGWGLATPWFPSGHWTNNDITQWPAQTLATFTQAWDTSLNVTHNRLWVDFLMYVDTVGAVGEARLLINGTQYGPTVSTTGAGYGTYSQVLSLPQSMHQTVVSITIEQRRVSGTGNVRCTPRVTYGRSS